MYKINMENIGLSQRFITEASLYSGFYIGRVASQHKNLYKGDTIILGRDLQEVGSNLFDSLIMADKKGYDVVYTEAFENKGVGRAIMNRLLKSAGYKVIKV